MLFRPRIVTKVHDVSAAVECPPMSLTPEKKRNRIAIVACGCFWDPQQRFKSFIGAHRVVVGYTGGQHTSPTFHNMQDHTKALFVECDPSKITYQQLFMGWLDNDCPWEPEDMSAHRSAFFVLNKRQKRLATEFLSTLSRTRRNRRLHVDIEPPTIFYRAEECQQDCAKKQRRAAAKQMSLFVDREVDTALCAILE